MWDGEEKSRFKERVAYSILTFLVWLDRQQCKLPEAVYTKIAKLRRTLPEWRDDWANSAADSREARTGWVRTETDSTSLNSLPISQIVVTAIQKEKRTFGEFVEHRPFQGLTAEEPLKAMAALSHAARNGSYPEHLWRELLSSWPDGTSNRLSWVLAFRLSRLPSKVTGELRHDLPRWLEKRLPALAKDNLSKALRVWDLCLHALIKNGPDATKGSLGDSFVGGKKVERSRRTDLSPAN
jgi:hypothetical protein